MKKLLIASLMMASMNTFGMKRSWDQMNEPQQLSQQLSLSGESSNGLYQTDPTAVDNWVSSQLQRTIELKQINQDNLWKIIEEDEIFSRTIWTMPIIKQSSQAVLSTIVAGQNACFRSNIRRITNYGINICGSEKSIVPIFEQVLENHIRLINDKKVQKAEIEEHSQKINKLLFHLHFVPGREIDEGNRMLRLAIRAELPEVAKNLLHHLANILNGKMYASVFYGQMSESARRKRVLNDMSKLVNKHGWLEETILSYALRKKYFDLSDLLIWYGATQRDDDKGLSVIDIYVQDKIEDKTDAVKYLIERGADINEQEINGWSVLHYAAEIGDVEFAKYLVERGANFNIQSIGRQTPLHLAVEKKHEKLVEYLLSLGASVDIRDIKKYTPLHEAVSSGNENIVKSLVEHGANVNMRNDEGQTPLAIARQKEFTSIADYLESKGAIVIEGSDTEDSSESDTGFDWYDSDATSDEYDSDATVVNSRERNNVDDTEEGMESDTTLV